MIKKWLVALVAVLAGYAGMAQATEEPVWTLVSNFGEVELRHYEAVVQARTRTTADSGSSSGFRTLAGYIFGGNSQQQEIAMTAPVERTLAQQNNYMAFFMPADHGMDELPAPDNGEVSLHQVPARTVAVIRFSGWARDSVVDEKVQELLAALGRHGIEPLGEPSLAQYNPPWTPPWSRRNEIMVEVALHP